MSPADDGLIHAYQFDGAGGARRLDWGGVSAAFGADATVWIHLDLGHPRARQWISGESGLSEVAVEALLAAETRPRATAVGDGLLVALRGVNLSPGSDPEDMVAIRLWIDARRIVSTRRRRLLSASDIADSLDKGSGPRSAGEFLVDLTDRLISRMAATIGDAEDRVAEIEEQVLSAGSAAIRTALPQLRREVVSLRRYLSPQREAMSQLQSEKTPWISPEQRIRLREINDHLIRYIEDLDSVRDRAAVTQEELMNRLSEQMNARMYVLSVVAAFFLPLGFLTGLLGINVAGIPGAESRWAFFVFLAVLVVVVAVQIWIFRRKRWL